MKAPTLADFWTDNFKVLVEARSGGLHIKTTGKYCHRRRMTLLMKFEVYYRPRVCSFQSRLPDQQKTFSSEGIFTTLLTWLWGSPMTWVRAFFFLVPSTLCSDQLHPDGYQEPREWDSTHQRSSEVWDLNEILRASYLVSRNPGKLAMLLLDLTPPGAPLI